MQSLVCTLNDVFQSHLQDKEWWYLPFKSYIGFSFCPSCVPCLQSITGYVRLWSLRRNGVCRCRSSPKPFWKLSVTITALLQLEMLEMLHICSPMFFMSSWEASRQFSPWCLLLYVLQLPFPYVVPFSYAFSVSSLYFSSKLWNSTLIRTSSLANAVSLAIFLPATNSYWKLCVPKLIP